jgi:hypothetical protein
VMRVRRFIVLLLLIRGSSEGQQRLCYRPSLVSITPEY